MGCTLLVTPWFHRRALRGYRMVTKRSSTFGLLILRIPLGEPPVALGLACECHLELSSDTLQISDL